MAESPRAIRILLTRGVVQAMLLTMLDRLRSTRLRAGLSAGEFSRLAGLTRSHVGLVEAGTIKDIGTITASALAGVLGCSLDWLVRGEGEPPSDAELAAAVAAARARFATEHTGETTEVALP